jgi:hypothetical protein
MRCFVRIQFSVFAYQRPSPVCSQMFMNHGTPLKVLQRFAPYQRRGRGWFLYMYHARLVPPKAISYCAWF